MTKRLKQDFPLKYFLGNNQNAIEIQMWMNLICQLILLIVQRKAEKGGLFLIFEELIIFIGGKWGRYQETW